MHILAQRPVLVPQEFQREVESLSKAALMDLVWDFATTAHGEEADTAGIIATFRERAATIVALRKSQKS